MFSSLSSYIWGSAEEEQQAQQAAQQQQAPVAEAPKGAPVGKTRMQKQPSRQQSAEEEDWVLVGNGAGAVRGPALTLGSLNEINPRPSTGSTGSSEHDEEDVEEDAAPANGTARPVQLTRSQRRLLTPFSGCQAAATLGARKAARAAQSSKQKRASKTNTAKATERQNKAVKHTGGWSKKVGAAKHNLSIKASGHCSKGLKQC